ncbi:MAG: metallophosphoesterase family protein [Anaerovoracaceae bacterium]|jgi:hypothetical protein
MKKIITIITALTLVLTMVMPQEAAAWNSSSDIGQPSYPVVSLDGNKGGRSITFWAPYGSDSAQIEYSRNSGFSSLSTAQAKLCGTVEGRDGHSGFYVYKADLSGLADDYYYFRAVSIKDGVRSTGDTRRVLIGDGQAADQISFAYMGDAQPGQDDDTYDIYRGLLDKVKSSSAELCIMGGDMVNDGQSAAEWENYMKAATGGSDALPLMMVPGNHECNVEGSFKPAMYKVMTAQPQNGPRGFEGEFYSFDYGSCHFTMLNSDVFEQLGSGVTQADIDRVTAWIKSDLAASKADWKIVVMHHPAFPVVSDNISDKVRSAWAPVFESEKADIVFCGHQHVYMRTKPLLHKGTGTGYSVDEKNGVTYVMGVSGSKLYSDAPVSFAEIIQPGISNYQLVTVSGMKMTVQSFGADGSRLDGFTLASKQAAPAPAPQPVKPALKLSRPRLKARLLKRRGRVRLYWKKVSKAKQYRIYRSRRKNRGYKLVKKTRACKWTSRKLKRKRRYYYRVRAYSGKVISPRSNTVSVRRR